MGGMITRKNNDDGSTTVVLGGSLSIEDSGDLHRTLSEALEGYPQVYLDMKGLESLDMTGMQIICSGCKTAATMGRGYDCELDSIPECLTVFGSKIGGPRGLACAQNDNKPCIWYGGMR